LENTDPADFFGSPKQTEHPIASRARVRPKQTDHPIRFSELRIGAHAFTHDCAVLGVAIRLLVGTTHARSVHVDAEHRSIALLRVTASSTENDRASTWTPSRVAIDFLSKPRHARSVHVDAEHRSIALLRVTASSTENDLAST
jgi:hypothetical protein